MDTTLICPWQSLTGVLGNILKEFILFFATVYTQDGEEAVTDLVGVGGYFIGWGTDNTPAAKGDSDLVAASDEARVAGVETQPLADKLQWVSTITSASGQTIVEVGLFDGAGAGTPPSGANLIIRSVFTGIVLANGDKIEFTITLEQT